MSLLKVDGLSKHFGGVHAVEDLSFALPEGGVHSIIGPNGAGKTTLFNLITGVYQPSEGHIYFADHPIHAGAPHKLAKMGISRTFQNLQICRNMGALENVMVGRHLRLNKGLMSAMLRLPGLRRQEEECREKSAELMKFVGVEEYVGTWADSMPYGALKRLEIARALAAEPRLLLLDEPAAGLNHQETDEIDELIQKVAESGVTVVLVEHDMKLVMGISDHIIVLDRGKKLTEGTAQAVQSHPDVITAYLGAAAA